MTTTTLSAGLGLKPEHFDQALACAADGLWFEVHPENYMVDGGPRLAWLASIAERHPLSLHGVAMSLGGDAPPDLAHLRRLRELVERLSPALVSEHLAWSRWGDAVFPDLLPVPRTAQALARIADNVARVQDTLGRRIAIENPSHYLHMEPGARASAPVHAFGEIEFLSELVTRTGCGLLLDVNNVYVSANNLGYDAGEYLDAVPAGAIDEVHLAGHSSDPSLGPTLLVDSHDAPVDEAVWSLYRRLVSRVGPRPTLIERDAKLPAFAELLAERERAHAVLRPALREAA